MNPLVQTNVGTLVNVGRSRGLTAQYALCTVSAAAIAWWLPGWWKLLAVPLAWWGLAGLGVMPTFDVTPVVNVINCAAPTLKALGGLL